jgi:hypothetical protein
MSKVIEFEPINLEDPIQKAKVQFEAKIFNVADGNKTYPVEETGFIYQEFSGFAPKKFIEDPSKRDFVKIQLDPKQKTCMDLKTDLSVYDEAYEENEKKIFGKWYKLYKYIPAVRPPKGNDEVLSDNEDEENDNETQDMKSAKTEVKEKYETCKMKLKTDWFYYYEDKRLDKNNTNTIKKAVSELMNNAKSANMDKEKKKAAISALVIRLTFTEEGKKITKEVSMKDIEQKKEIDTKVFYRRPEKLDLDAKKPNECSEEELIKYYGEPLDPKDVRTAEDLDQYYRYRSYIRILYTPFRLWASKDKLPGADKRTCGIKFIINSIDIIQLPYENNNTSTQKMIYSKYAFGKKNNEGENLLINQSVDNVFTSVEKAIEKHEEKVIKTESDNNLTETKTDKKSKTEKKQMKVESDSEESEQSDEDEDQDDNSSESAESEESEEKPEPPKKTKGGKTVVETVKNTKTSNKKTK